MGICAKTKVEMLKTHSKKSHFVKNALLAFLFGGLVCALGESSVRVLLTFGIEDFKARIFTSMFLIFLSSMLTSFGVFDNLCKVGGAGFLLPITGFANSITSEAIDSRSEGYVLGVGAKIFTVAGPVILYATTSGVIYGLILYIVQNLK